MTVSYNLGFTPRYNILYLIINHLSNWYYTKHPEYLWKIFLPVKLGIRDLLGHVSIQTTEIYARADSKLKREALEKAYEDIANPVIERTWEKDPKLKTFLKGLV